MNAVKKMQKKRSRIKEWLLSGLLLMVLAVPVQAVLGAAGAEGGSEITILHHQSRRATAWLGTGYFHTLFVPSATLLPLEYCLNLIDQEMIGNDGIEDLEKWRAFIKDETGVELTIIA